MAIDYDPKYHFDELLDVAFAEIRCQLHMLEEQNKIECDLTTEEIAYECKRLAHEFIEWYNAELEKGERPADFYGALDSFTYDKLTTTYPLTKKYSVIICANAAMKLEVDAHNADEAEELAQQFIDHPNFFVQFRGDCDFNDVTVDTVWENKA